MDNIKLKDIKEQYLMEALSQLGYRFKIFTTVGSYVKAREVGRVREGIVNTLMQITDSDIIQLGGNLKASAIDVTLSFLLPVPDTVVDPSAEGYGGEWDFVEEFRDSIANAFATTDKFSVTSDNKTYVGGVTGSFPMTGELLQRQGIGQSVEYTCYLQFTYLCNAINSRDVQFFLDGDEIPYTRFMIARKNTVSSALLSNAKNGEASCYAESSSFGVDLSLPALDPKAGGAAKIISNYLMGFEDANKPHTLLISFGNMQSVERTVIFGEVSNEGETVQNVAAKISFIPYMEAEGFNYEDGEEDEEGGGGGSGSGGTGGGNSGIVGEKGEDGKSAYELWLEAGNYGTVEDFLESLKGKPGPQGPQGPQGEKGEQGAQGPQGVGIQNLYISNGILYAVLTNGTVIECGSVGGGNTGGDDTGGDNNNGNTGGNGGGNTGGDDSSGDGEDGDHVGGGDNTDMSFDEWGLYIQGDTLYRRSDYALAGEIGFGDVAFENTECYKIDSACFARRDVFIDEQGNICDPVNGLQGDALVKLRLPDVYGSLSYSDGLVIPSYALSGCGYLRELSIPAKSYLGQYVIKGCYALGVLRYRGSFEEFLKDINDNRWESTAVGDPHRSPGDALGVPNTPLKEESIYAQGTIFETDDAYVLLKHIALFLFGNLTKDELLSGQDPNTGENYYHDKY